ncbi:hypothetical protein ACFSTA_02030 [Ornithinibacillus salinisoli]|uniref:FbpB family small basic protein n=1 Tax=Ornithinibacillus salinisoli TaxID=1848459 RepID=A0ABW4VTM9_9BACI
MPKVATKLPNPKEHVKEQRKQRLDEIKRYEREIKRILGKSIKKKVE